MTAERRLMVVAEALGVGGTETHLIRLLPPLASRGWSIAVFCISERGQRADQLDIAGIRVFPRPRPRKASKPYKNRNPLAIAAAANRLFWLMRHWHPHIVHFYLPGPYLVGTPLAVAAGAPIKIMSRRSLSNYQKHRPFLGRLEQRFHRVMDALVGNSQEVVNELIGEGVPRDKIHLIYNGIAAPLDLPDRSEARKAIGLEQVLVGVMIANLIPYKGHQDLIEGLAAVSQSLPLGWRMLCVGRDEGMQGKLERLAEAHGIKENIQFLGERIDTTAFLAAADFCVLSSWEEGFSNVVLEAMAAGLPIVVTRVGGNPEAVTDQETGLVVPPRDPKALGNAILRLAQDPDLRQRLGAAAQRRVKQEFAIENCVESHNRLYEDLMNKRL